MNAGEQPKEDKRRDSRWNAGGTEARIAPKHKVSLLNISRGGVLIEHSHVIRPGTNLFLSLLLPKQGTSLRCRVVRSREHGYEVLLTGEQHHVYRTALEFQALSEDSLRLIDEFIDSLRGQR